MIGGGWTAMSRRGCFGVLVTYCSSVQPTGLSSHSSVRFGSLTFKIEKGTDSDEQPRRVPPQNTGTDHLSPRPGGQMQAQLGLYKEGHGITKDTKELL